MLNFILRRSPVKRAPAIVPFVMMIALATLAAAISTGAAAKPKRIGTYQHWRVFVEDSAAGKLCYAVSEPRIKRPSGAKRGEIFLSITHRLNDNIRYEPSVRVGYPMSASIDPIAEIDGQAFRFFSGAQAKTENTEWAWLETMSQTDMFISELKKGNQLDFTAQSERGTLTRDSYSLLGFTRAIAALDKACAP